jgi:hypothetical protein
MSDRVVSRDHPASDPTLTAGDEPIAPDLMTVDPGDLAVGPPFSELFPIRAAILDRIAESMARDGYDKAHPIVVWRARNLVVEGHTRRQAAIKAGVEPLAYLRDFADEDEALLYAIASQRDRRNLTDAELVRCVEALDSRLPAGRPKLMSHDINNGNTGKPGKKGSVRTSAAATAKDVGTSESKVNRIRYIEKYGSEEIQQAVKDGRMSVNKAWVESKKLKAQKKAAAESSPPDSPTVPIGTVPQPAPSDPVADPEPASGPEPAPSSTPTLSPEDLAWLESLPLRAKVVVHRFDDDALIYRHFRPAWERTQAELVDLIGTRSPLLMCHQHRLLHRLAKVSPISAWQVCPKCGGRGVNGGICRGCRGCGYVIPNL